MMDAMSEVTQILSRIDLGDPSAADHLLPLVYEELRKLAAAKLNHEKPGQTLQATALVHEAYLRLLGKPGTPEAFRETDGQQTRSSGSHWNSRGHFFAAAAEAMRRILIEHARKKHAEKRGGSRQRMEFTDAVAPEALSSLELLALNEAMEQLARDYPQHAALVKLRFFGGLTLEDAASTLGISVATAKRRWTWARAWLFGRLATPAGQPEIA